MAETASGRKAYHVSKPNPFMMREARKRIGLRTGEVIMIGDTMDTGIREAAELGLRSILVLAGSSTGQTLRDYPFAPARLVKSVAGLAPVKKTVHFMKAGTPGG